MENRKLAAILAADIVGYSRLAGADEERTLIRLRSLRSEFLDPTIQINNGRVVKRIGDGIIVEFRSVVDATRCAVEIQRGMSDRNASVLPAQELQFRIGIHVGDVVEEADGDLMGDGVNIAARLEGVAKPGAICLSEDAYRQVRNRLSLSIDDLGMNRLKNIAEPIRVFSVGVETAAVSAKVLPRKAASRAPLVVAGLAIIVLALAGGFYAFVRTGSPPAPQTASAPVASNFVAPAPPSPIASAAPSPIASATPSPPPPATLKEAGAELNAGHYDNAFRLFSEIAESGDTEAQRQLGRLYRDGRGTARNAALAAQWLTKSAEQGNAAAQSALSDLYWRGVGVEQDPAQALRWAEKSAAQNNAGGQNELGVLYESGFGVTRDYGKAREWFRKGADQGFGWALANLGFIYLHGWGVDPNYAEAYRRFKAAADQGNPGGEDGLGELYREGLGVERDPEKAFDWFRKSADHGYDWGQINLADMMQTSPAHRDYAKARRLLNEAIAQGNSSAMNRLGSLERDGVGGAQDFDRAFDWFSRAANRGYGWGMVNLAYLYANGQGVAKNCEQAKAWLAKAVAGGAQDIKDYVDAHPVCKPDAAPMPSPTVVAPTLEDANAEYERGHYEDAFRIYSELADGPADPWAQANVGEFYRRGLGVARDYGLARRWFQKAADQGNPLGQNGLGLLYQNGLGVEQDYAQALQWFRKSADQRYGWGLANLGTMYKNGWGVAVDYDAALRSYKAAAAQDNPGAQNGLGVLYENGWGVQQDLAEAFNWYSRAAKQGFPWGMANLGYLYARGGGVAEDCDQAKAWFSKALASGGQDVRDYLISHQTCEFDASAQ
jgi:uncharacterized protein